MAIEFTAADQLLLEHYRLERFCEQFAETLPYCRLHVQSHNQLTVHCPTPWMVDVLLTQSARLRRYANIILGVKHLSICFAQEEIYRALTTPVKRRRKLRSA
jgi:hypothetical protein